MANQLPGVEVSFSRTSDISLTAPNNRLLIAALVAPGAPTTIGTPFLATSAAQVDAQAGGGWTHASRLYRASKAQTSDAETWILPLADPAGTPATRTLKFAPAPTYDNTNGWTVGSASGAAQATDCTINVAGQSCTFSIAKDTTWANVAAAALVALSALGSELIQTPSVNSDTITLTAKHGAEIENDLPILVSFSNVNAGCAVITGTLTLATDATGAGSVSLSDGVLSASVVIANTNTPATRAVALRDAVNVAMPCRAAVANPATGVITLYHKDDRWLRRLSATITAAIGMTAVLAAGTVGTGTPSLTSALTYLAADQAYKIWAFPFADSSSLGTLATHILAQDVAEIAKGQFVVTGISTALPASSLPGATSPALTTTELFTILHDQGSPVRVGEVVARVGAELAAEDDAGRNYNGLRLLSSDLMPLPVAHRADRATRDTMIAAVSAGYAPVTISSGNETYVVLSRTTFASANAVTAGLRKWSGALLPIALRASLRQRLSDLFFQPGKGKSLKAKGIAHTDRGTTTVGIRSEIISWAKEEDLRDYLDYASDLDSSIRCEIDLSQPGTVKARLPLRTVKDLDKILADTWAS